MKRINANRRIILLVLLITGSACTTKEAVRSRPSLSPETVENLEYRIHTGDLVQLSGGKFAIEQGQPPMWVSLVGRAFDDLNGDGILDAAVVLTSNFGGSATIYELIAVLDRDGTPVQAASLMLGANTPVESIAITGGRVIVEMLTHGEQDGMCCPSVQVVRSYGLDGGQFVEV